MENVFIFVLPPEIFAIITEFLPLKEISNYKQVCSKFYAIFTNKLITDKMIKLSIINQSCFYRRFRQIDYYYVRNTNSNIFSSAIESIKNESSLLAMRSASRQTINKSIYYRNAFKYNL